VTTTTAGTRTTSAPAAADPTPPTRKGFNQHRNGPVFWIGMIILALIFAIPMVWMYVTSIKTIEDSRAIPINLIPGSLTVRAFQLVFSDAQNPVFRWALNSLVAATAHSLLVLVVASMAAYALARMKFRGQGFIFALIISTLFVPTFIFLMPNFLLMNRLGWLDTLWALIVPGAAGAFGVFFLRQFFIGIPRELEESALIDGANTFQILTRVVLPISQPALVTLAVLSFLANWNDFVWPVFVLFSSTRLTLPAGLASLQGAYNIDYPVIMAGATIASVPVLILYIFVQRYIIEGVATSGLKG